MRFIAEQTRPSKYVILTDYKIIYRIRMFDKFAVQRQRIVTASSPLAAWKAFKASMSESALRNMEIIKII